LGTLTWACSIYDGATPGNHLAGPGADGSDTGDGGAGGVNGVGTSTGGGGTGGDLSTTTSSSSTGATSTTGEGGAAGASVDASHDGAAGTAGAGGAGMGAGGAADASFDAKDQASEPASEAKPDVTPDVAPDTGCPSPTLCALKAALVHRYTFDGTGTRVTDSVGTAHGTVINAQLSGTGTLVVAGGSSDQYVDLPNGIVKSLTNATFEAWVTWNGGGAWQRIFDFGDSTGVEGTRGTASTTFYLTPQAMTVPSFPGPAVMVVGFKRSDVTSNNEAHVMSNMALATATMVHVAVVVDDTNNQMTLYKNGAFESAVAFPDSFSVLNDVNAWLGRSQYATDAGFGGTFHEFRIYGAALSATSIQASYAAGTNPAFLD
jgi:hypothetical protein